MKSFFSRTLAIFGISLLSILLVNCKPPNKPNDDGMEVTECCDDAVNPTGTINAKDAKQKIDLYVANQYAYINEGLNTNYPIEDVENAIFDNREVWFDLENLKNYICYVEEASEEKGYTNLGLRIYFGATKDENGVPLSTALFWPTHREKSMDGSRSMQDDDDGGANDNENSYELDGLNFGSSGRPPKVFAGN